MPRHVPPSRIPALPAGSRRRYPVRTSGSNGRSPPRARCGFASSIALEGHSPGMPPCFPIGSGPQSLPTLRPRPAGGRSERNRRLQSPESTTDFPLPLLSKDAHCLYGDAHRLRFARGRAKTDPATRPFPQGNPPLLSPQAPWPRARTVARISSTRSANFRSIFFSRRRPRRSMTAYPMSAIPIASPFMP